jgi:Tfp pilus assembly protein PilF
MKRNAGWSLAAVALLVACGGSEPPKTQNDALTPPKLPPSMGGGPVTHGTASESETPPPPAETAPSNPEVAKGLKALEARDFTAAKSLCEPVTKKNPKDADAWACLGEAVQGDAAAAEKAYRKALEVRPDHEGAAQGLSGLLVDAKRFDDAAAVAKAGLAKHPQNAALDLNLALALAEKNDQQGAMKAFDDATRLAPSEPMFLVAYGQWLVKWKQPELAVLKLRDAVKLARGDAAILATIALEMQHAGAFADCISTLDRAISSRDAAELRMQRGICKMGAKDKPGALADLQAAVQQDDKLAPAHFYLGGRLAEAGKLKEAQAEYEAYLKLAPNGPLAKPAQERVKFIKDKSGAKK